MDATPKVQRKVSLSLGNRFQRKRHSASPQHNMRINNQHETAVNGASDLPSVIFDSPKVKMKDDRSPEGTPPNRRSMNFDDSIDFSPKMLDVSLSPSCMFSQTMSTDCPEVDWRWNNKRTAVPNGDCTSNTATHDSTETTLFGHLQLHKCAKEKRRREQQRKHKEQEYRRAEALRAHEMLKERCERFHKQLEDTKMKSPPKEVVDTNEQQQVVSSTGTSTSKVTPMTKPTPTLLGTNNINTTTAAVSTAPKSAIKNDAWDDFMNDSDTDGFLLEATQKVETEIISLSQLQGKKSEFTTTQAQTVPVAVTVAKTTATAPTTRKTPEKRSSFYMKFLEDETPDDWFVALDEAVLQASQSKKPRTSLQRYKSMPTTATLTASTTSLLSDAKPKMSVSGATTNSTESRSIKRHASTHTIGPMATHARAKQFGSRK